MSGEDLIVVLGRQIACGLESERLLGAHHDRVDEPAQQHHKRQNDIHDADALMVNARDPFAPQIGEMPLDDDPNDHSNEDKKHHRSRYQRDRLVPGNSVPGELAQHISAPEWGEPQAPRQAR